MVSCSWSSCEKSLEEVPLESGGVIGPIAAQNSARGWKSILHDEKRRSFVSYRANAFSADEINSWWHHLYNGLKWNRPTIKGRLLPRSAAWLTTDNCTCTYKYSGTQWPAQKMEDWFLAITDAVCRCCGISERPNSCNANLYEDGGQSVGWHADDEPFFDSVRNDTLIISLSLGAARTFVVRPNDAPLATTRLVLGSGDVCTMEGLMQKNYQHAILREQRVTEGRINLTWRWVRCHDNRCCKYSGKAQQAQFKTGAFTARTPAPMFGRISTATAQALKNQMLKKLKGTTEGASLWGPRKNATKPSARETVEAVRREIEDARRRPSRSPRRLDRGRIQRGTVARERRTRSPKRPPRTAAPPWRTLGSSAGTRRYSPQRSCSRRSPRRDRAGMRYSRGEATRRLRRSEEPAAGGRERRRSEERDRKREPVDAPRKREPFSALKTPGQTNDRDRGQPKRGLADSPRRQRYESPSRDRPRKRLRPNSPEKGDSLRQEASSRGMKAAEGITRTARPKAAARNRREELQADEDQLRRTSRKEPLAAEGRGVAARTKANGSESNSAVCAVDERGQRGNVRDRSRSRDEKPRSKQEHDNGHGYGYGYGHGKGGHKSEPGDAERGKAERRTYDEIQGLVSPKREISRPQRQKQARDDDANGLTSPPRPEQQKHSEVDRLRRHKQAREKEASNLMSPPRPEARYRREGGRTQRQVREEEQELSLRSPSQPKQHIRKELDRAPRQKQEDHGSGLASPKRPEEQQLRREADRDQRRRQVEEQEEELDARRRRLQERHAAQRTRSPEEHSGTVRHADVKAASTVVLKPRISNDAGGTCERGHRRRSRSCENADQAHLNGKAEAARLARTQEVHRAAPKALKEKVDEVGEDLEKRFAALKAVKFVTKEKDVKPRVVTTVSVSPSPCPARSKDRDHVKPGAPRPKKPPAPPPAPVRARDAAKDATSRTNGTFDRPESTANESLPRASAEQKHPSEEELRRQKRLERFAS